MVKTPPAMTSRTSERRHEKMIRTVDSPEASYAEVGGETAMEPRMQRIEMTNGRVRVDSGSPWEPRMGYSRAMKSGPLITVAGCVGIEEDGSYPDTLGDQTRCALGRIEEALETLGAGLEHLTRIRIYTTCIDRWEEIAEVMGPAMEAFRPPNALVEVARLVDEEALVEIEVDAWFE